MWETPYDVTDAGSLSTDCTVDRVTGDPTGKMVGILGFPFVITTASLT
jgi:hypothetical protein